MNIVNDPELKTQRQHGDARKSHAEMILNKRRGIYDILMGLCGFEAAKRLSNAEQVEAHTREAAMNIKMGEAYWREGRKHERMYRKILEWFPAWYEKKRKKQESPTIKTFRIELYFPEGSGEWRTVDESFIGTESQADLRGQALLAGTDAVEYAIHLKKKEWQP